MIGEVFANAIRRQQADKALRLRLPRTNDCEPTWNKRTNLFVNRSF